MNSKLRVLIVEDSESDALLVERELRKGGFEVEALRVETEPDLRDAMEAQPWDLVISDYALPKLGGLDVLGILSESGPDMPVIVVSGKIGEDAAVAVMKAGAGDYIMKDRLSRLVPAVERELRECEDRRARRRAEEENVLLNRLLQTIFEINKMIVREKDRQRLLDETCRILVEHGGFLMAWVGMVNEESGIVEPVAWAGFDDGYIEKLGELSTDDSPQGRGPSGTSVRLGRHSIFHDVETNEDFAPWRDSALKQGYRSCAAFPLMVRDRVVGNVNVYSSETTTFGEKMTFLLDDLTGDLGFALGALEESEDRRRAEEALRDSNERFSQLFEQNEDALMLIKSNLEGVIDVNRAAERLTGYSRDEIKERCCRFFDDQGRFVFHGVLGDTFRDGSSGLDRVEAARKDGSRFMVSVRTKKIRLRDSDVIFCAMRDITQVVMLEEEARTMQARLIHANKMTSLGTMASGIAHEINNPNNFIMFNSSLLKDAWMDSAKILDGYYRENGDFLLGGLPFSEMKNVMPELLVGISDGSRRIKNIIDSLRDFSRMDTSGLDGIFDVNKAVKASTDILSSQVSKYTDNFHVTFAQGLPLVRGSLQKIEQVLINLVLNALQALPEKKRGLWITTGYDAERGIVTVEVRDEGCGIPKDILDRITDPFFTTKADIGGTGLGLSISYTIIKEHKGTLEFGSTPGEGTTVTIRLPASDKPA